MTVKQLQKCFGTEMNAYNMQLSIEKKEISDKPISFGNHLKSEFGVY